MKRIGIHRGSALLAACLLACSGGAGDGDVRSAVAMDSIAPGGSDRARDSVASIRQGGSSYAPSIASLALSPDPPTSGGVVRAAVRVASGEGGYELEYRWEVAGRLIQDAGGSIDLPAMRKGETVRVTVVASNAAGRSAPVSAESSIPNTAPTIVDLRIEEKIGDDGEVEAWTARALARDPDGDVVEYEFQWLLNGRRSDVRGDEFPLASLSRGDRLRLRVVASDGEDRSPPAESGTLEIANRPPEIVSMPPPLDPSGVYRYRVEAEDPDGDRRLRFELVSGPVGMQMDEMSGELSWTPSQDQAGRHEVEVAVDDRRGGSATQAFVIPIIVRETWSDDTPASIR